MFKSGKFYLNEVVLNFHVDNAEYVHKHIYPFLTSDVEFNIEGDKYIGFIDGENAKADKMTLFIKIKSKDLASVAQYKGQLIKMSLRKIPGRKTKRYAHATLHKKAEWIISLIASEQGNTITESAVELEDQFSKNLMQGNFTYQNTDGVTLGRFMTFLEMKAEELNIKLKSSPISDFSRFIRKRTIEGKCALCDERMEGMIDVFPLCAKHFDEEKPKTKRGIKRWKQKFMKDNNF